MKTLIEESSGHSELVWSSVGAYEDLREEAKVGASQKKEGFDISKLPRQLSQQSS